MIGVGQIRVRTGVGSPATVPRRAPGVINENEMVRREARMERQPEQARIVPTLALVADIEHEFFLRRDGRILERPHAAFAFPYAQFVRARHSRQPDGIGKEQVCERDHRRPVARNTRRSFGHRTVQKSAHGRARGEAVGFGVGGKNETNRKREGKNQSATRVNVEKHPFHESKHAQDCPSSPLRQIFSVTRATQPSNCSFSEQAGELSQSLFLHV